MVSSQNKLEKMLRFNRNGWSWELTWMIVSRCGLVSGVTFLAYLRLSAELASTDIGWISGTGDHVGHESKIFESAMGIPLLEARI